MPKNTRQHLIQELQRAEGNVEWAIKHINVVGAMFAESDRKEAQQALTLVDIAEQLKSFIKDFYERI